MPVLPPLFVWRRSRFPLPSPAPASPCPPPRPRPPGRLALVGGTLAALALGSALVVGLVGGRS